MTNRKRTFKNISCASVYVLFTFPAVCSAALNLPQDCKDIIPDNYRNKPIDAKLLQGIRDSLSKKGFGFELGDVVQKKPNGFVFSTKVRGKNVLATIDNSVGTIGDSKPRTLSAPQRVYAVISNDTVTAACLSQPFDPSLKF